MRFYTDLSKYKNKKGNINRKLLLGEIIYFYDKSNNIDSFIVKNIKDANYITVEYNGVERFLGRDAFLHDSRGYNCLYYGNDIPFRFKLHERIPDLENLEVVEQKIINSQRCYKLLDHNSGFDMRKTCYKRGEEFDYWITEHVIMKKRTTELTNSCVQPGINDIATVFPEMLQFLKDKEIGKKVSVQSKIRVETICPECGRNLGKKRITRAYIHLKNYGHLSCICQDGISIPNKFIANVLEAIDEPFEREEYITINNKKYFYDINLLNHKYKIEMDGGLGHKGGVTIGEKTIEECIKRDLIKDKYAERIGERVIRIKAEDSSLDYLKDSIMKSELVQILPALLQIADDEWIKIYEDSLTNLHKIVCEFYKNNYDNMNFDEIAAKFKINKCTVWNILKKGNMIGWCDYIPGKTKGFISDVIKHNIIKLYLEELKKPEESRLSLSRIGMLYNTDGSTVKRILKNEGYKTYNYKRKGRKRTEKIPIEVKINNEWKKFSCMNEIKNRAIEVFGFKLFPKCIKNAIKNNTPYKGLYFRYCDFYDESQNEPYYTYYNAISVYMFDLDGKFIRKFSTISAVEKYFNKYIHETIKKICETKSGICCGYQFRYEETCEPYTPVLSKQTENRIRMTKLVINDYKNGINRKDIAQKYNIGKSTVDKYLRSIKED